MSFYTSLSGLKGAQTDMSVISNNIANANSIGFKRSKAQFGDIFASSPTQSTKTVAGQGQRLIGITQQFTQGSYETSEKTLDLAIVGVPSPPGLVGPRQFEVRTVDHSCS